MTQNVRTDVLKWKNWDAIDRIDFSTIPKDCEEGCILKVEIKYPKMLYGLHNNYPLLPAKIQVEKNMSSIYC